MLSGVLAALGSLYTTQVLGLALMPDVEWLTGGLSPFPSPLGTLVGLGGPAALGLVQAAAIGCMVGWFVWARVPLGAVALGSPVFAWLMFLGVDAAGAVLFAAGWFYGRRLLLVLAVLYHLAVAPLLLARSRLWVLSALVVGVLGLAFTPYRGALEGWTAHDALLGAVAGVVVAGFAIAPAYAYGVWRPVLWLTLCVGVASGVVARSQLAHGLDWGTSMGTTMRYGLPVVLLGLAFAARERVSDGRTERPTTAPSGGMNMRKRLFTLTALLALGALFVVPAAFAQTVPAIPVSDYGDSLLSSLATAIGAIFPYAAAITAFAIGVGMVKRWLGHRKATRV